MIDLDRHLAAIAAGDPDAFARWVAGAEFRIRESLRSFATVVDTEAVVQETLLRVWQVAPRVVPDGRPNVLVRLGVRIGRNLAVSETRRDQLTPTELAAIERPLADEVGDPIPADPLLARVIRLCREKLPNKPAMALVARLEGAARDEDLATGLGMKLNTFLQNFTRARRFMAECLKKHGVDLQAVLP